MGVQPYCWVHSSLIVYNWHESTGEVIGLLKIKTFLLFLILTTID